MGPMRMVRAQDGTGWSRFEDTGIARSWPANAIIFRQDDCSTGVHILTEGTVKLFVARPSGSEQTLHIRATPGPLTVLPLLDGGTYATSARSLTPCRTVYVPLPAFKHRFTQDSDFQALVLRELGNRLREMIWLTESVTLNSILARVASFIQSYASDIGALDTAAMFRLPISQEELAHLTGTTRESVARALGQLRRAGVIQQHASNVRVCDAAALLQVVHTGTLRATLPAPAELHGEPGLQRIA